MTSSPFFRHMSNFVIIEEIEMWSQAYFYQKQNTSSPRKHYFYTMHIFQNSQFISTPNSSLQENDKRKELINILMCFSVRQMIEIFSHLRKTFITDKPRLKDLIQCSRN